MIGRELSMRSGPLGEADLFVGSRGGMEQHGVNEEGASPPEKVR